MIHAIQCARGLSLVFFIACGLVSSAFARETDLASGTWKFERSQTYRYPKEPVSPPPFPNFVISNGKATFSMSCTVATTLEDYFYSDVFQSLSKSGDTQPPLDRFLTKEFALPLAKTKKVLHVPASASDCADPVIYMFFTGKRIVIPVGDTFYSYVSAAPAVVPGKASATAQTANDLISPYKITPLPMDVNRYLSKCTPKILAGRRLPQTTDKCAPDFYPYVADAKSSDALMKLVGTHDYTKAGSQFASLFSPPFTMKTAATFLVFPPMMQVVVIRVDDFEVVRNEQRDVMNGVYISIVSGKVIDQWEGCSLNREYHCLADSQLIGRLLPNGKFQKRH